jgi:peptidoglycan/xylan/chitin deacetylase (PgdA/CDA1 family)
MIESPQSLQNLLDLHSSVEMFESQIKFLSQNHTIISMSDFLSWLEKGTRIPGGSILMTFDDGYSDVYRIAFPVLQMMKLPACVFLTTDCIGTGRTVWTNDLYTLIHSSRKKSLSINTGENLKLDFNFNDSSFRVQNVMRLTAYLKKLNPSQRVERLKEIASLLEVNWPPVTQDEFPMLNWNQIRMMGNSIITFGSHSVTHPILSACSDEQQWSEISHSKSIIEQELKQPCEVFAYPNGQKTDYSDTTRSYLEKAGYRAAFTFHGGIACQPLNKMLIPRQPIFEVPIYSFAAGLA